MDPRTKVRRVAFNWVMLGPYKVATNSLRHLRLTTELSRGGQLSLRSI